MPKTRSAPSSAAGGATIPRCGERVVDPYHAIPGNIRHESGHAGWVGALPSARLSGGGASAPHGMAMSSSGACCCAP